MMQNIVIHNARTGQQKTNIVHVLLVSPKQLKHIEAE